MNFLTLMCFLTRSYFLVFAMLISIASFSTSAIAVTVNKEEFAKIFSEILMLEQNGENRPFIKKWKLPITYQFRGHWPDHVKAKVNEFYQLFSEQTGVPIAQGEIGNTGHVYLRSKGPEVKKLTDGPPDLYGDCAFVGAYSKPNGNEIQEGDITINVKGLIHEKTKSLDEELFYKCLTYNSLEIFASYSISQYSAYNRSYGRAGDFRKLTPSEVQFVRLINHPKIKPGMNRLQIKNATVKILSSQNFDTIDTDYWFLSIPNRQWLNLLIEGMKALEEKNSKRAIKVFYEALNALDVPQEGTNFTGVTTRLLALANASDNNYYMAQIHAKKAVGILEQTQGPDGYDLGRSLLDLGSILTIEGDMSQAEDILSKACRIIEKNNDHVFLSKCQFWLGRTKLAIGAKSNNATKLKEAGELTTKALKFQISTYGPLYPDSSSAAYDLGYVHMMFGQGPQAIQMFERAIIIYQNNSDLPPETILRPLEGLHETYAHTGQLDEAENTQLKLIKLLEQLPNSYLGELAGAFTKMAEFYESSGQLEKANAYRQKAAKIQ